MKKKSRGGAVRKPKKWKGKRGKSALLKGKAKLKAAEKKAALQRSIEPTEILPPQRGEPEYEALKFRTDEGTRMVVLVMRYGNFDFNRIRRIGLGPMEPRKPHL